MPASRCHPRNLSKLGIVGRPAGLPYFLTIKPFIMQLRNLLAALLLLFTFSSFSSHQRATQQKLIVYSGCFNTGVTVTVSYNPGTARIVGVSVQDAWTSYPVTGHSGNATIYNSGSTLYASGFNVYFTDPIVGPRVASWDGELATDCN